MALLIISLSGKPNSHISWYYLTIPYHDTLMLYLKYILVGHILIDHLFDILHYIYYIFGFICLALQIFVISDSINYDKNGTPISNTITSNVSYAETCTSPGSSYQIANLQITTNFVTGKVTYNMFINGNQGQSAGFKTLSVFEFLN